MNVADDVVHTASTPMTANWGFPNREWSSPLMCPTTWWSLTSRSSTVHCHRSVMANGTSNKSSLQFGWQSLCSARGPSIDIRRPNFVLLGQFQSIVNHRSHNLRGAPLATCLQERSVCPTKRRTNWCYAFGVSRLLSTIDDSKIMNGFWSDWDAQKTAAADAWYITCRI